MLYERYYIIFSYLPTSMFFQSNPTFHSSQMFLSVSLPCLETISTMLSNSKILMDEHILLCNYPFYPIARLLQIDSCYLISCTLGIIIIKYIIIIKKDRLRSRKNFCIIIYNQFCRATKIVSIS